MNTEFKKQLRISLGILIVAIVVSAGAIYFFSNDLTSAAAAIAAEKTSMSQQSDASFALAHLKNDAPKAANDTAAINEFWSTEDQLIGFPQWLTNVGQADNVSVESAFSGTPTPASATSPGTAAFSMTAQGSLADLTAFVQDLESNTTGFLVSVDSFSITYQAPDYTLSGSGKVYFHS